MRYLFIFTVFSLFMACPAQAQDVEKMGGDGLSYTTLGARKERTDGHMNYELLNDSDDQKKPFAPLKDEDNTQAVDDQDLDDAPAAKGDDEVAADKVWDKYKALAAGKYEDEPKKIPVRKMQPAAGQPDEEAGEEKPAGGIASIIEQYRKNKVQRSQMRTITITPEETETPPVDEMKSAKSETALEKPKKSFGEDPPEEDQPSEKTSAQDTRAQEMQDR